jgi:hypothetical protein
MESELGDFVDLLHCGGEFGFGVVLKALFEGLQDFLAVAVSDGHYEGEVEFLFVVVVEILEAVEFFGGALVYAGALLFLAGGWREFVVGVVASSRHPQANTRAEFAVLSFGVGSYSGSSGQVGMGPD